VKDFSYYFFDLYHTLVRVEPYPVISERECNQLQVTAEQWSDQAEFDYVNRALGRIQDPYLIVANIVRQLNPSASDSLIRSVYAVRAERFRRALTMVDQGILAVLHTLRQRGKKLVLVSNADVFDTRYWPQSPLAPCFDASVFSCDAGYMKPDREIYTIAADRIHADLSQSVFIGDGGHQELRGAQNAGMTAVLTTQFIQNMWPESIPALASHADYVIDHVKDLLVQEL
jgi:putative hydrolase of the HAD superfamily